jgi:CHAT domain-containing protein/predicted negative regulator of RcsB-dependent stress response
LASKKLADLLQEQHSDPWLQDFMSGLKPGDTAGLVALQQAIQANQKQHADEAKQNAQAAVLAFRKSRNPAGELLARYEEVYAFQRSLDGKGCLSHIDDLEKPLRNSKYHGLLTQFLLEKAVCEKRAGRPGEIEANLTEAQQLAEKYQFNVIYLRVIGIEEGLKKEAGACPAAWAKASKGLEAYWQGKYPLDRLYQLYQPLSECAEKQELWHTADAFREHAIAILTAIDRRNGKDSILLGAAYFDWANILTALKKDKQAINALKTAVSIFDKDGTQTTTERFRAGLTIRLAELQLKAGDATVAFKTLEPVLHVESGDAVITLWANRVLGDIYKAKGELDQAVGVYQAGITLSERSLATVASRQERLDSIAAVDRMYRGLTEIWLRQNRPEDAWKLWEWYKSRSIQVPGTQEVKAETNVSWPELEKKILHPLAENSSTPRVVYAVFDNALQTWIVQDGRVASHTAPVSRVEIERKTNLLFERASNPSSDLKDVWSAGEDLYSPFWRNIESDLPKSGAVVVELDAPIQHLLLEALRFDNHYLTEHFQFIYSPGIIMDTRLRATRALDSNSSTFLLDASTSSGESPIPSQIQEVRFVSKGMARANVRDGSTITLPEIRSVLQHNEIFFFAGHGLRDGKDLSLVVNPNLFVRSSDLLPEDLGRLQLAILAACSTGTSDANGLMDTRSLDNSFLAAGVPRVISSRWDVDSDSTADLMEGMVTKLGHKTPVATAMYSVQQDILKKEQHPYYWAGFYLAGRAN